MRRSPLPPIPLMPEALAPFRRGSIWLRPIPRQPGLFASDRGDIWSVRGGEFRKLRTRCGGHQPWDRRGGYLQVTVKDWSRPRMLNGKRPQTTLIVHVAVAEAWMGPRPAGCEVDHCNDLHLDNRPKNLCYLAPELHRAKHNASGCMSEEDWEAVI